MNNEKRDDSNSSEAPAVFHIAQLPVSGGSGIDRRSFLKGTVAAVGAGAMMTMLGGCGGDDGDGDPCVCNSVCPCEQVGACQCDVVACQCQLGCECHTVCPCEAVSACTCDVVQTTCVEPPGQSGSVAAGQTGINFTGPSGETRTMPCGTPIPPGWICTCNCVTVPAAKPKPKPTPSPCSCHGHVTSSSGHYWYPC